MLESNPILDVMRKRHSCRTYQPRFLDPKTKETLAEMLDGYRHAPFPGAWRFRLVTPQFMADGRQEKIGTYGTITGARHYIAGVVRKDSRALLNYGYLMERVILDVTAMGLATCWLGGAFHRSNFSLKLNRADDELLPAVTPVGYAAETASLQDNATRWVAGAKNRKDFDQVFKNGDFKTPLTRDHAGAYAQALEMVRLAPSASNRQPWRVVKSYSGDAYHFFLQRNTLYGRVAKLLLAADDLQQMDMGIAMCHFELAAHALELKGRWQQGGPDLPELPPATTYVVSWMIG